MSLREPYFSFRKEKIPHKVWDFGAGNQNRTDDLVITNDVLYRLSHTSIAVHDLFIIPQPFPFVNTFFNFSFLFFHFLFFDLQRQLLIRKKLAAFAASF